MLRQIKAKNFMTIFLLFLYGQTLLACPCGCGAMGPLMLSAGETWKFQTTLSRDFSRSFVMETGRTGDDDRPDYTDTLSLGLARALTEDLSVSLQVPFHRNSHKQSGKDDYSYGDPSAGGRYTVFSPEFDQHYLPQVHL